jgi:endonuclease/exonuclease/phosphatase family metal-dependent hydrolase
MPSARAIALGLAALPAAASAQLRIAAWNISTYDGTGGREAAFRTSLYGSYQGRSMAPDLILVQEVVNAAGATAFLGVLNSAPGSPGDWAMADFVPGPDTNLAFYYRAARLSYLSQTLVLAGGNTAGAPRDIRRYDVRLIGYTSGGATLAIYGDHMKSGATSDDQSRRLVEATAIRTNTNALPAAWQFVVAGDFNIQSSAQAAYQQLIGAQPNNRGRCTDPINTPGSWNGASSFRFVHTQAPGGNPSQTGGMDDRFDFILLGGGLADADGFEYIGNVAVPYSTTSWNDPNHSFRAWGEDGSFFNSSINITSNAMVGPTIAAAIKATCDSDAAGGHLPVFLDLRVPPRVAAPASIDFGEVEQNSPAQAALVVANGGDVALWTAAGISPLNYSLAASAGFTAPAGGFAAAAGAPGNSHTIFMSTANLGPLAGAITITSNAPDEPARLVQVSGVVVPGACYANCDGSTVPPILNVNDFICFQNRFAASDPWANCDGSTEPPVLNVNDFICFINVFGTGCP